MKDLAIAVIAVVALGVAVMSFTQEPEVVQPANEGIGAMSGPDITQDVRVHGTLSYRENNITVSSTTEAIRADWSGSSIVVEAASGTTMTLPALRNGLNYRFVIGSAFDTANVIIDSAEGDNIDGTLVVAGAVVDCRGEDQLNFVNDGEAVGDFVEVRAVSGQWVIGDSGVLTSAKLTCTDPS